MIKTIVTKSFSETQKLGKKLAEKAKGGTVIALHGDLGSGKTTFIQGFAQGLGITKRIISPTFIIMRTYEARAKREDLRFKNFYHVDLYRIESERDIEDLGLIELLNDPQNVIAIEWPEKIEKVLPEKRIDLYFEYMNEDKRKIIIKDNI